MAFNGADAPIRQTVPNPDLTEPPRAEYDAMAFSPLGA